MFTKPSLLLKYVFGTLIIISALVLTSCKKDPSAPEQSGKASKSNGTVNTVDSLYVNRLYTGPDGKVYAGTPAGLYVSDDNAASWCKAEPAVFGRDIEFAYETKEGTIFAVSGGCSPGVAVMRSTDGGQNWTAGDGDALSNECVSALISKSPNLLFAATAGKGIFKSTDNGVSWSPVSTGLPAQTTQGRTSIGNVWTMISLGSGDLLASTMDGIYRSTNNGENWTLAREDKSSRCFVFLQIENGTIFTVFNSLSSNGLIKSTNNAQNWEYAKTNLKYEMPYSLAKLPNGNLIAAGIKDIALSIDNGQTWTLTSWNEPNLSLTSLAGTADGKILAGTSKGIFISKDSGKTWVKTNP